MGSLARRTKVQHQAQTSNGSTCDVRDCGRKVHATIMVRANRQRSTYWRHTITMKVIKPSTKSFNPFR